MIKIKEYQIFKSAKKTADSNNLVLCDGIYNKYKRLFDFSLLDDMPISEDEKEVIKGNAIKFISASSKESFYGCMLDYFTACEGRANYHMQRVYTGKTQFIIFTLANISHNSMERKSIHDKNYHVIRTTRDNGFSEPLQDIEIA